MWHYAGRAWASVDGTGHRDLYETRYSATLLEFYFDLKALGDVGAGCTELFQA